MYEADLREAVAKKRRGRKFRRYIKGRVDESLDLGTLAAKTLAGVAFDENVNERTFVSSIVAAYALSNYTPAADDGPLEIGIAHNDYSDAEVEAWVEATGTWNEGDRIGQEIAKRLIRSVGFIEAGQSSQEYFAMNDGKPIKTKLGWILNQGVTLKLWVYNHGTSALATTTADLTCAGHANLWPQ